MKLEDVKNTPKDKRKTVQLNVRVTPKALEWLKENQVSISKICNVAMAELGYKEE